MTNGINHHQQHQHHHHHHQQHHHHHHQHYHHHHHHQQHHQHRRHHHHHHNDFNDGDHDLCHKLSFPEASPRSYPIHGPWAWSSWSFASFVWPRACVGILRVFFCGDNGGKIVFNNRRMGLNYNTLSLVN